MLPATLGAGLLALACAAPGTAPVGGPPPGYGEAAPGPGERHACATVVGTNDTHGQLLPRTFRWTGEAQVGGAAALGGWLRRVREESRCPVFLLSGGDVMQGTPISNLTRGESTIAVFNLLGYDAAATGNHEFDWGIDVFRARIEQARFPFLGANVYIRGTDRHPEWLRPWTIVERGGVRVGVIGLATESTPWTTRPSHVAELEFRPISSALEHYIPQVRAQGVDFVVAVMHAGGFCERDRGCEGEAIEQLSRTREPFDYAVTGHTHSLVRTEIGGAPVVQSRYSTAAFSVGLLERGPDGRVTREVVRIVTPFVDSVAPATAVAALVERYRARVAEVAERPVATLAEPLHPGFGGDGDHALGRLIADAQRAAAEAEVAIMNNGGIRTGLPAGAVTYGDLFQVQPFQNIVLRLQLRGRELLAALEHALGEDGPDANISGLTVRYRPEAGAGERIVEAVLEDGRRVHPDSVYVVAANDFMAEGGSGFVMLRKAESRESTGMEDLDALVAYLKRLPQPVRAPEERRWIALGGDG